MSKAARKRKRRLMLRRKRTLDPSIAIDYKRPDTLKRFITDRGKVIPRRISGATAAQQRAITTAIKRARYLAIIPYTTAHRPERGFAGEMAAVNAASLRDPRSRPPRYHDGDRPPRDSDRPSSRSDGDSDAKTEQSAARSSSSEGGGS